MPLNSEATARAHWNTIVAGGGAAGVFAAIACAEAKAGQSVLVLEKGAQLLTKVRVSGGGRCNVTHACFDPAELSSHYPRGGRELIGPFHAWQPEDTVRWFEARGVRIKTEPDGRMFPVTDSSQTIIDCLLQSALKAGVIFLTQTPLIEARPRPGGGFVLRLAAGRALTCDRLLVAAGGLKPGPILEIIRGFGHTIEPLAPSLFTFHVCDPRLEGLQGVSVARADILIPGPGLRQTGPMLITHAGLSGPAVLKLSAWGARWIREHQDRFTCRIDWTVGAGMEDADSGVGPAGNPAEAGLEWMRREHAAKAVRKRAGFNLPLRLWERLVEVAGIPEDTTWSHLSRTHHQALMHQLTQGEFRVSGKSMFKEEFVTCGGVRLAEIQFKTMESRLVPGLHFAGETLDIDGETGGFNFQAAWTTGYLAGQAMAGL